MRRALALLAICCAACTDVNSCETGTAFASDVCIPPALAASVSTTIELRESCGPACTDVPACTAIFRGAQLVLDVEQEVCVATSTVECPPRTCQQRPFLCKLPPLMPGDWPLALPGGSLRLVHVREGGDTSCRFTDGGVQ